MHTLPQNVESKRKDYRFKMRNQNIAYKYVANADKAEVTQRICIVSGNQLESQLIALKLKKSLDLKCTCLKTISIDEQILLNYKDLCVYLVDFNDLENTNAQWLMDYTTTLDLEGVYVALYNVSRNIDIQKFIQNKAIRGIFYQNDPAHAFLKGIKTILNGELWLTRQVLSKCLLSPTKIPLKGSLNDKAMLSLREKEILKCVATGASNKDIAQKMSISLHTVKTHLYNIFRKLNVPNRLQATLWAFAYMPE
jgi:DNA-binding NarL/FixJ family response regulator